MIHTIDPSFNIEYWTIFSSGINANAFKYYPFQNEPLVADLGVPSLILAPCPEDNVQGLVG